MKAEIYKKLFWIIKRPRYYLKFFHSLKHRLNKKIGTFWCLGQAIDTNSAIIKIIGKPNYKPSYQKFKEEIKLAKKKKKECPVEMGGGANLELIYQLAQGIKATKVIETGIGYGWSSLAFLLSLQERKGSLVSIDIANPPVDDKYIGSVLSRENTNKIDKSKYTGCIIPERLYKFWTLIRKPDRLGIDEALKILPKTDICHYDSDKTYEGRMFAYPKLWKSLRNKGIFISDDIGDNLAFKRFANRVGREPIIIRYRKGYIGVLIK